MGDLRKITAFLPTRLIADAQANSGEGLTQTLKLALERYNRSLWYERLLAARGKFKLDIDLDALREDREFDEHGNVR